MKNYCNLSSIPACIVFDASPRLRQVIDDNKSLSHTSKKYLSFSTSHFSAYTYSSSDEVAQGCGEITILAGRSLRNLIARYPYRSRYVVFHADFLSPYLFLAVLGFLRRYFLGLKNPNSRIRVYDIYLAKLFNPFSLFVVLKNPNATVTSHYSINQEIGYSGFLDYLNETGKKYVVLRFFEKLPEENRKGGDLDLLVEDDLEGVAACFLAKNPGTKMVDMYSVHSPANAARIPYHTPFLSQKILDEAIIYNGYKVPSHINYLHSFIYHCLYHKGLSSGIPTKYTNLSPCLDPDNDYLSKIYSIAGPLGIQPGSTLEELDEYMGSVGWKPHADTLDLLSSANKWLAVHNYMLPRAQEVTLTICVLKVGFFSHHGLPQFRSALNDCGLHILSEEGLSCERLKLAANHLRGGNWSATNSPTFLPQHIFVLFDSSINGLYCRKYGGKYDPRDKKERLRKIFDVHDQSMIHMTDNTHQSLEYLELLYPHTSESVLTKISAFDRTISHSALPPVKLARVAFSVNLRYFRSRLAARLKQLV